MRRVIWGGAVLAAVSAALVIAVLLGAVTACLALAICLARGMRR